MNFTYKVIHTNIHANIPGNVNTHQVRIVASDGGDPTKTATATVQINVQRNLFAPKFQPQRIDRDILETHPLGEAIANVNATDQDTKAPHNVIRYEITGSENSKEFFLINEMTGEIYIKKPLSEDKASVSSYTVRDD